MFIAICFISLLTVIAFLAGLKLSSRLGTKGRYSLLVISLLLAIGYVFILRDSSFQILLLRTTNTVFYGKWLLIIAGFAAGVIAKIPSIKMFRKVILISALFSASSLDFLCYFLYQSPEGGNVTEKWLCTQTTYATCSAAAAATQ